MRLSPPRVRSGARPAALVLVAALALGGCAWVGPAEVEQKVDSLDHDGDGAPYGGPADRKDCDDFDDRVAPGFEEIAYDGVDNDCGGDGDLVDIDGDGYAGVSRAAWQAEHPDAVWPAGVQGDVVDCVDDPAIHPEAKRIHPGASETPYDGIDSDCLGDTDFDVDEDGYLPDTFRLGEELVDTREAFEAYVAAWGYDLGEPVFGDCNDFDGAVNPGVPAEDDAWYDGVDADCDGRNDFDQDGDGYMPDHVTTAAYENYVDQYHAGDPPWGVALWGDCLDQADPARPADPAAVHPGAEDAWYDGIDADCDGANDFDQDADGVMPDLLPDATPTADAWADYVAAWGYALDEQYGDCLDTDPLAYPGALERFGDTDLAGQGIDSDCDGHPDATPWAHADFTWDTPRPPVLVATDDQYVLTTSATAVDLGPTQWTELGVSLTFDRAAGYLASPDTTTWQGSVNPQPLGSAVDAVPVAASFWAATTYTIDQTKATYTVARRIEFDTVQQQFVQRESEFISSLYNYHATGVDLVVDVDGNPWAAACEHGTLSVFKGIGQPQNGPHAVLGDLPANCDDVATPCASYGPPADLCFFDGAPDPAVNVATVHTCQIGVGCTSYAFDATAETLTVAAAQPYAAHALADADHRDGWHVLTDQAAGGHLIHPVTGEDYLLLADWPLLSFDAVWHDGQVWAVAVVSEGGGRALKLAWGDPAVDADLDGVADLQVIDYPFDDPDLTLQAAAIHADADRLVLAVTADHATQADADMVGWVFLGW